MKSWGFHYQSQNDIIEKHLRKFFKYYDKEFECYKDLLEKRSKSKKSYMKIHQKIFKQQDEKGVMNLFGTFSKHETIDQDKINEKQN